MLTGDDTPAPTGETAPAGDQVEAPAPAPETPAESGNDYEALRERYDNLHSRFGSQGNELGSLRQKLTAYEQEMAELRSWRKQQERTARPADYEREARLNKFIADPDAYIEERYAAKLTPLQEKVERFEAREAAQREQATVEMIEGFRREHPDVSKYADEINGAIGHVPRELLTKALLKSAYMAAKYEAGQRAEESARKKAAALTQSAALPKGVAPGSGGNAQAGKAKNFDQALARAKARVEAGG